ncbi:hypothetical protein BDF19DRAFT_450751 [Syncephalis fuscata]|nr:hypothetical protein BDF19DRAFT_450751 [Syncephalis fuscata]
MSNSHSNLPSVSLSQDPSLDDRWRKNTVISHSPDLSSITDSDPSRTPTFSVSLNQHNISSIALQPPPAVSSHTLSVPPMGRSHGSLSRQSSLSQQSTNGQHGTGSVYYAESLNGPEDIHEDEDEMMKIIQLTLSNSLSGSITGAQYALSTDMEMENYSIDIHLTETGPSSAATTHSMAQRELMHNQPSYHLNEEDEEDLSSEQYHDRYYSPSHEDRFAYRPFISNNEDHSSSEENISRYIPGDRPGHTPPAINMGYDLNTSANTSLTIHTPVVRQGTTPSTLTLTSMGQSRGITSRSRINHHHHHGQPTSPTAPTVLVATPAVSQFLHPQTGRYTMMDPSDTNDDDEGVDGHRTLRKGRSF